jgi:ketosteroid isomerase-like protein
MTWLSDDPTWLAGGFALAAVACFLALKSTQQGKFLIWGLTALAGAGLVLVVEHFWVTDEERIEAVVYDLRAALLANDVDGMLARMTPEVQYVQEGQTLSGPATRGLIQASMAGSKFEIVRIHNLQTSAGRQTRRGKAEFKVFVQGSVQGPFGLGGAGTANTTWSLGFEETKPGVWMVNRITPISLPFNVAATINTPKIPPGEFSRRRSGRHSFPPANIERGGPSREMDGPSRAITPFRSPEPAK